MSARQKAHFAADRPQIPIAAPINAFLFFQNADAKRLLLDVIECLRDREGISLRTFLQDCHLHFLAQRIHGFRARDLAFGVKRAFDPVARNAVSDIEQFLVHLEQLRLAFRFAHHRRQFFLNANHLARMAVRELKRL